MIEEEKEFYGDEEHFLLEYDDEIEELKADIEEYRDNTTWWSNRFNAVERDNRELRDRIDKAIEYIEENEYIDYNPTLDGSEDDSYNILPRSLSLYNEELDKLLEILKGSDKE